MVPPAIYQVNTLIIVILQLKSATQRLLNSKASGGCILFTHFVRLLRCRERTKPSQAPRNDPFF